jgi:RNA polymerase sigma-70 factor (ECF subfamily)
MLSIGKESGVGRHSADWTAPGSTDPDSSGTSAVRRVPRHADLFVPTPGSAAAQFHAKRTAETFDQLVEPHRAALHAYVLRNTKGDEAVAESVLRETLYRASYDPRRYPRRASAVRAWLILTAYKALRDGERHAPAGHDDRHPGPGRVSAGFSEPAPGPADEGHATTVVSAMLELTAEHRELIIQTFYGGASLEEVAADRGAPLAKIKSDLYAAMHALRAVLDRQVAGRHGVR